MVIVGNFNLNYSLIYLDFSTMIHSIAVPTTLVGSGNFIFSPNDDVGISPTTCYSSHST